MRTEISLRDLAATKEFAAELGSKLSGGEIITFASDLGGGKTTIIKYIVKGAGSSDTVSSPTFTITNTYKTSSLSIYHFDFYRLSDPGIISRELDEVIGDKSAVVLIEWPEIIESILPKNTIHIQIEVTSETSRKLIIDYPKTYEELFKV